MNMSNVYAYDVEICPSFENFLAVLEPKQVSAIERTEL